MINEDYSRLFEIVCPDKFRNFMPEIKKAKKILSFSEKCDTFVPLNILDGYSTTKTICNTFSLHTPIIITFIRAE